MWTWIHNLLQLFYPRLCLLCQRPLIESEQHICLYCFCDLARINYQKRLNNNMLKLFAGTPHLNEAAAFLRFERDGRTQTLVHSFKYYGNKQLAKYLGRIAATEMKANGLFKDMDMLVPVPLHPKKQRQRGYNQSEWIAKGIESVYQCPVGSDVLRRETYTDSQTRKTTYERHLNVEEIFFVNHADSLAGKHILLIDDVTTTGATLHACIKPLSAIPDIRISVFSLSAVKDV